MHEVDEVVERDGGEAAADVAAVEQEAESATGCEGGGGN